MTPFYRWESRGALSEAGELLRITEPVSLLPLQQGITQVYLAAREAKRHGPVVCLGRGWERTSMAKSSCCHTSSGS